MGRLAARIVLALVIGYGLYRVAVATMPTTPFGGAGPAFCPAPQAPPHFDLLTGVPVGWTCRGTNGEMAEVFAPFEMASHWGRSMLLGVAGGVLAALTVWMVQPRRRGAPPRSVAVS